MDATHLHLILTHFPIVGTILGLGILIYAQVSKKIEIQKVALGTFVLMAIITIPVYLSGEAAEETVEHLAGVSERLIENHEELAEKAIWVMGLLGILSVINLLALVKDFSFARKISLLTLIVSLFTVGLFVQVGNLEGQIRHSEIRKNSNIQNNDTYYGQDNEEHEHDDD